MTDTEIPGREAFRFFLDIPTRWMDSDVYGHVNNVEYYSYMDTVVNMHLVGSGVLDFETSPAFGVVVETGCKFLGEIRYPELIQAGIRVTKLGNSSVTYQIGLFRASDDELAALGHFVHVYVDRGSRRPVRVPDDFRAILEPLMD
ncbi:MAG TPA: thioesterase [Rhodospirillaceae bacterium]|nr:thioesterase [Rhodospirillaceae bacterium]HAA93001.1 thioesterase [Rhodospirillaceae bacterium]HAT35309.1 thioesterase [Rhodospirillaceae bacterium]